jgi:hypothetical protein
MILTAVFEWLGTKAGEILFAKIHDSVTEQTLIRRFRAAVEQWTRDMNIDENVGDAMFYKFLNHSGDREHRDALLRTLSQNGLPSREQWSMALKERFVEVQNIPNRQDLVPFFQQKYGSVAAYVDNLANKLWSVCILDDNIFKTAVMQHIQGESQSIDVRTDTLHNFSDFLDNKRVLYLPVNIESKDPLIAMTLAVDEIRKELGEVIKNLPTRDETRQLAKDMQGACMAFNDAIKELPFEIRNELNKPIEAFGGATIEKIGDILTRFRTRFIVPMCKLFNAYKIDMPPHVIRHGIQHYHGIPNMVYANGLPVKNDVYFGGDSYDGIYLRLCTLTQMASVGDIRFDAGTELIFYDPIPTGKRLLLYRAMTTADVTIKSEVFPGGMKIYFDEQSNAMTKDPGEPVRMVKKGHKWVLNWKGM